MTETVAGAAAGSTTGTLALSVHGRSGVLDLLVPEGASAVDVLREYAKQTGERTPARLCDHRGTELPARATLADAGIRSGSVVVATYGAPPAAPDRARGDRRPDAVDGPGPVARCLVALAAGAALLAGLGVLAGGSEDDRRLLVGLLLAGAFVGVLPLGRLVELRVLVAPVFGGTAALVAVWDPASARLPMVVGIAALGAAVTAAVARAATGASDEQLRVWMWAGSAVFVVAGLAAVLGLHERVVWATLLLLCLVAGRFVPGVAVDVPDQTLVDLERLAVSAWSARDRTTSRRTRTIIRRTAVEDVVERGARLVGSAAMAVLAVSLVAAPLVLSTTRLPLDEVGAPLLVSLVGCTQLLVARSYRHPAARVALRLAGLWCLGCVLVAVVAEQSWSGRVGLAAVVVGVAVVAAAVALGRGWRSVWWGRRAEIAEALSVAFAVPAFVVTVGVFRRIWEIVG
ncbi:hypothetical protein [Nocardioides zeae]|uniref:EccD-like transmembrane domain-containing protein n=1 Tax=Nocardioides zeae TaxID=1457234 RepID=A0A6P0HND7_9ACTN|nr:hypothetical protein [Nocardioides zeae]NEN79800.1 hypothetical protein [Nocardioides zeae]